MTEAQRSPSPPLRAYALAARRAAKGVAGVAGLEGCVCEWLAGGVPGVTVLAQERHRLVVEIRVIARLGHRVDEVGRAVQAAAHSAFEQLPGLRVVTIDVVVTGIRYDKRALPKRKESRS